MNGEIEKKYIKKLKRTKQTKKYLETGDNKRFVCVVFLLVKVKEKKKKKIHQKIPIECSAEQIVKIVLLFEKQLRWNCVTNVSELRNGKVFPFGRSC